MLLGVDRLDYTKGIVERLQAFERLLEEGRIKARDCVMVQLAVPTRGRLEHYAEERRQVEQLVGSINGRFGRIGYPAVHYLHQSLTLEELVPLYQAADVMLVTPLGDGMNLVAKEFAVSRIDGAGVLVLSEFAGAADELTDALVGQPARPRRRWPTPSWRPSRCRPTRRKARMAAIRATVEASDVRRWARGFLDLLGGRRAAAAPAGRPTPGWRLGLRPGAAESGHGSGRRRPRARRGCGRAGSGAPPVARRRSTSTARSRRSCPAPTRPRCCPAPARPSTACVAPRRRRGHRVRPGPGRPPRTSSTGPTACA